MLLKIKKRVNLAYRLLLKGETPSASRGEVPAIMPEEVAEARQFFPLGKFFIFGHARSGTTLLTPLGRPPPPAGKGAQNPGIFPRGVCRSPAAAPPPPPRCAPAGSASTPGYRGPRRVS